MLLIGIVIFLGTLFFGEFPLSALVGTICILLAIAVWQKARKHLIFSRSENRVISTETWRWLSARIVAECTLDEVERAVVSESVEPETQRTVYWLEFVMKDGLLSKIPKVQIAPTDKDIILATVNDWHPHTVSRSPGQGSQTGKAGAAGVLDAGCDSHTLDRAS